MDRIFGKISFSSCIKCDLRGDNAILHLYEEYKSILNNNTTEVNNMDLTIYWYIVKFDNVCYLIIYQWSYFGEIIDQLEPYIRYYVNYII